MKKAALFISLGFLLRAWSINFGLPYDGIHPTESFSVLGALYLFSPSHLFLAGYQHPFLYRIVLSLVYYTSFVLQHFFSGLSLNRLVAQALASPSFLYMAGRFLSLSASVFTGVLLYRSGIMLGSRKIGVFAAALWSLNFLSIKFAHYAVPDSLAVFFTALSLYCALILLEDAALKNYVFLGIFAALALSSKFSGVAAVIVMIMGYIMAGRRRNSFYVFSGLGVFIIVFCGINALYFPHLSAAFSEFVTYLSSRGYGLALWPPAAVSARGIALYPSAVLPQSSGYLAAGFALAGYIFLFLRRRRVFYLLLLPPLLYLAVLAGEMGALPRNMLVLFPFLFLAAGFFLQEVEKASSSSVLSYSLLVLALGFSCFRSAIFDYYLSRDDTRVQAEKWMIAHIPKGKKIAFGPYTPIDLAYSYLPQAATYYDALFADPSASFWPPDFWRRRKFDYLVVSSFREKDFLWQCLEGISCRNAGNFLFFARHFKLVKRFSPPPLFCLTQFSYPSGTWPHNPEVKIYKIE